LALFLKHFDYPPNGGLIVSRQRDDLTIERWRTEPRPGKLEFGDDVLESAPPLWKDLTVASAVAILLWAAAAIVFG
jgi:hypothetical protein